MPRMARVVLPQYPHHVVQRGHNRQVVFAAEDDYWRYLEDLQELKAQCNVQVYAYCLMTNHVHLLLAPDSPSGLGRLMKALAAPRHPVSQPFGAAFWNLVGKSVQVELGRYRPVSAGLLPLH